MSNLKLLLFHKKNLFQCTAMDVLCFMYCGCVSVLGKIRSAVGSAQLLMSQKFQQFYWLCQQNLVRNERLCVWVCCVCFIVIYANCGNQPFSVFCDATANHESLKADIADNCLFDLLIHNHLANISNEAYADLCKTVEPFCYSLLQKLLFHGKLYWNWIR